MYKRQTLDHLTLRKSLENNIDGMDFSRFILIADRGICNYPNLLHVTDAENGYIVSKSLLKSTKKEQEWAYSDEGYTAVSEDFKYKSRIVKKTVKDENGDKRTIEEKVVVYWSRKFQARAEQENRKFLDFFKKLEEHPENFRITPSSPKASGSSSKKSASTRRQEKSWILQKSGHLWILIKWRNIKRAWDTTRSSPQN